MSKIIQYKRQYECPDCKGCFFSYALSADEPPPVECSLCHANMSAPKKRRRVKKVAQEEQTVTPMRSGGNRIMSQSVDSVYRKMESASENRMMDAAELLGINKSMLSSMKMTDMKDNIKEGESTMPSDATKLTGSTQPVNGLPINFQDNTAASEYAKSVGQGPIPFAGNAQREVINLQHDAKARTVAASGQLNRGR